jgi:hypothetical protein
MLDLAALSFTLFLAAGGAVPPPSMRGDTTCPTIAEVGEALAGLAKPAGSQRPRPQPQQQPPPSELDIVQLGQDGDSVNVTLANASGEAIASRRLPASLPCAERARAAAVIIAAWQAQLGAGARPSLPVLPRSAPPPAVPAVSATAMTTATKTSEPAVVEPPVAVAAREPAGGVPAVASRVEVPPPAPIEIETGAALLASVAAGDIAPAIALDVALFRPRSRFALGASALAVGTHATTIGDGRGSWRRVGAVIDLRTRMRWSIVEVELRAGVAGTALAVTGRALPVTSGATFFDPGIMTGLRSRFRLGRLSPWVEAAAVFWPRAHTLYVSGTASSAELPAFEVFLGLGLGLGGSPGSTP